MPTHRAMANLCRPHAQEAVTQHTVGRTRSEIRCNRQPRAGRRQTVPHLSGKNLRQNRTRPHALGPTTQRKPFHLPAAGQKNTPTRDRRTQRSSTRLPDKKTGCAHDKHIPFSVPGPPNSEAPGFSHSRPAKSADRKPRAASDLRGRRLRPVREGPPPQSGPIRSSGRGGPPPRPSAATPSSTAGAACIPSSTDGARAPRRPSAPRCPSPYRPRRHRRRSSP